MTCTTDLRSTHSAWVLSPLGSYSTVDVLFGEDCCRTRQGNAAVNLAWLRKMALFRADDGKGNIPTRRLRAALEDYRTHLLNLLCQ
jgi:hypothetical protein